MKALYIVGGNGLAKECYGHVQENIRRGMNVRFAGFIGHNGYRVDFGPLNRFFVGDLENVVLGKNDYCIIGSGQPELRRKIYIDLKNKNANLYNLIVGGNLGDLVGLGEGNILNASFPSPFVKIGNGNIFNFQVIVAHDVEIGDFNFFGPRSQILGEVRIGSGNSVGANSVLLPKCKMGNNNKIAPLSALYRGCRDGCYMQGNPAVKIGEVNDGSINF